MNGTTIAFAGSALDRADHVRSDPEKLAGLMNWRARLLRWTGWTRCSRPKAGWTGARWPMPIRRPNWFSGPDRGRRGCFAEVAPRLVGSVAPPIRACGRR
jgi:NAD+ diphosphatase